MSHLLRIRASFLVTLALLVYVAPARGQGKPEGDTWLGRLADGSEISHEQLSKIIQGATDRLEGAAADAVTGATQAAGMTGADLHGAYLWNTQGLTLQQLSAVKTLHNAKLDKELREQIEDRFPHLFWKPTEQHHRGAKTID